MRSCCFAPTKALAEDADNSASELLDVLGWRHARTGPKSQPFADSFNVLGCNLDLGRIAQGELVARNKPGRVERLMEHFACVRGRMSLHEAQVVHGLLRYSCGFFAGRFLHQLCAAVMNLGMASAYGQAAKLADFCDCVTGVLSRCVPWKLGVFCERRYLQTVLGKWMCQHWCCHHRRCNRSQVGSLTESRASWCPPGVARWESS